MEETTWITQSDGQEIFIRKWFDQAIKPKGIVQISHGMAEHSERYSLFAKELNSKGYIVYANDHRGHGETGKKMGVLGYFSEKNGFERAVDDLKAINDQIKTEHPELPIILFGHSMGSFLIRRLTQRYNGKFDAVILSGTSAGKGLTGKIGRLIAKLEIKRLGAKQRSELMNKLSFGQYDKGLPKHESWLSRDLDAVDTYHRDPLCGFISTAKFYDDLLYGIETINKRSEIEKINHNLPHYFISGTADPVGNYSKGIHRVVNDYRKSGIHIVELELYPNARHELLFEINSDQIIADLLKWLNQIL